jgi:hypothetical protein
VPVVVTEQYPKALGSTVPELQALLRASAPVVAKTRFSMLTPEVQGFLDGNRAIKQVIAGPRPLQQRRSDAARGHCHRRRPSCRRLVRAGGRAGCAAIDRRARPPLPAAQVMLVGIEAHVCVLQTTLDLLERGLEVHLVVDGLSSQRLADRAVGLQRAAQSGAFLTSQEMVMFQLAGDAKHPSFKLISALAKEARPDAISQLQLPAML